MVTSNSPGGVNAISIGRYRCIRSVGEGGMGVVFLAYDPELARKVVLKLLHPRPRMPAESTQNYENALEAARKRLLREGRAMAKLHHPHVVPIYDVGEHQGQIYLAMEYLDGGNLHEWLSQAKRATQTWRDGLEVMLMAGRGLAAAHRAGMIHRDFKPANVLLSSAFEVKVTDFGLVRNAETNAIFRPRTGLQADPNKSPVDAPRGDRSDQSSSLPTQRSWHEELTAQGAVAGTLGYMAPEQMDGGETDRRSDVFSYCVTLYEALCGVRPFPRGDTGAIRRAIDAHRYQPPQKKAVPGWLMAIVREGLRARPEQRPASMDVLLAQLERGLAQRSRRIRLGAVGASLVGALGALHVAVDTLGPDAVERRCPKQTNKWQGIWDEQRKLELRSAFLATQVPWAQDSWQRVRAGLDDDTHTWAQLHHEFCRDTRIEGRVSDADMDLRMRCLKLNFGRYETLIDAFARADRAVVTESVQILSDMPELRACRDATRLRRDVPWPEDVATLTQVESLREALARVAILQRTGQNTIALQRALELLDASERVGFEALLAEVHLQLSHAFKDDAQPGRAREHVDRAIIYAQASGHSLLGVNAWMTLIFVRVFMQRDIESALEIAAHAKSKVLAAGNAVALRGELAASMGIMYSILGDFAKAEEYFAQSLEQFIEARGAKHPSVARSRANLALTIQIEGRARESLELHRRSIADYIESLGAQHPRLALPHANHASALSSVGRFWDAVTESRRGLTVCEGASEPGHVTCAVQLRHLALFETTVGNYNSALRLLADLNDTQHKLGRRGHTMVPWAQTLLAGLLMRRGQIRDALEMADRGLKTTRNEKPRPIPGMYARALITAAEIHLAAGDPNQAYALLDNAHSTLGEGSGVPPNWASSMQGLRGRIAMASGDFEPALEHLELAMDRTLAEAEADNPVVAALHLDLAQCLAGLGQPQIALEHADQAIALWTAGVGPRNHTLVRFYGRRAEIQLQSENFAAAIADFERALALWDSSEVLAQRRAPLHFGLARALSGHAQGADAHTVRTRARKLARQARSEYRDWGVGADQHIERIEDWLRTTFRH